MTETEEPAASGNARGPRLPAIYFARDGAAAASKWRLSWGGAGHAASNSAAVSAPPRAS